MATDDGMKVLFALAGMVLVAFAFWALVGPRDVGPSSGSQAAAPATTTAPASPTAAPAPTAAPSAAPQARPAASATPAPAAASGGDLLVLQTTKGTIKARLDLAKAPASAENVARYAREGFYDGLVFHRVVAGFVVQAGGFGPGMARREPTRGSIKNEAANGLKNKRGTLAMARTRDPDSATSQFYVNLADNAALDRPSPDGHGYAVFGTVVEGMDVVDAIAAVPTGTQAGMENVPLEDVVITRARME